MLGKIMSTHAVQETLLDFFQFQRLNPLNVFGPNKALCKLNVSKQLLLGRVRRHSKTEQNVFRLTAILLTFNAHGLFHKVRHNSRDTKKRVKEIST